MRGIILKEGTFKILHLGHLGVGSIFGMTSEGSEQNKFQVWLREKWNTAKKLVGVPQVLIIGGEPIEGFNPKSFAEDIWLPRKLDQLDMSLDLIWEWIDPDATQEILILYGHLYHGSREIRVEKLLAQRLGDKELNAKAGVLFEREYFGLIFRFWHGSSGAFVYKASSKERQIKFNLEESALGKTPGFDQQYTYHPHQYYGAILASIRATSCPAWKLIDTWAEFKHPDAWLPDIGVLVTTFEERFGTIRVNNDEVLFKPPFRYDQLEQAAVENASKARLEWQKVRLATQQAEELQKKPYQKELRRRWKKL